MEAGNSDEEYQSLLKAHVKKIGLSTFLVGDQIAEARNNKEYKMVFEREKKHGKKRNRKTENIDTTKWGSIEEL
jgi:hypothetical protein